MLLAIFLISTLFDRLACAPFGPGTSQDLSPIFLRSVPPSDSGPACVSDDLQIRANGENYTSRDGHFLYLCDQGRQRVLGCLARQLGSAPPVFLGINASAVLNGVNYRCMASALLDSVSGQRFVLEQSECLNQLRKSSLSAHRVHDQRPRLPAEHGVPSRPLPVSLSAPGLCDHRLLLQQWSG